MKNIESQSCTYRIKQTKKMVVSSLNKYSSIIQVLKLSKLSNKQNRKKLKEHKY